MEHRHFSGIKNALQHILGLTNEALEDKIEYRLALETIRDRVEGITAPMRLQTAATTADMVLEGDRVILYLDRYRIDVSEYDFLRNIALPQRVQVEIVANAYDVDEVILHTQQESIPITALVEKSGLHSACHDLFVTLFYE